MPYAKDRNRFCNECYKPFRINENGAKEKFCSVECRTIFHRRNSMAVAKSKPEDTALKHRINRLKREWGLSWEEFNAMFKAQDNLCAICKSDDYFTHNWNVDHCHKSGKIRGILCAKCNKGLGMFKDNTETLKSAIEYLEKHKCV